MKLINYISPLTATKKTGYKQVVEYFNKNPEDIGKIVKLSSISMSRYNPTLQKTTDVKLFLKRPVRYYFSIISKKSTNTSYFMHTYYYDKKEDAIKAHHKPKVELYDQLTAPYLKQLKINGKLSLKDKDNLFKIFEDMQKLKQIS